MQVLWCKLCRYIVAAAALSVGLHSEEARPSRPVGSLTSLSPRHIFLQPFTVTSAQDLDNEVKHKERIAGTEVATRECPSKNPSTQPYLCKAVSRYALVR
jgi:hypothetical protein